MKALYDAVVKPVATAETQGAWYRQWRLVSLDGSAFDVADTADNEKEFGRPGASRGASAYPKIRFVGLLENGTHVLFAARMADYATDELKLAEDVVPALRACCVCPTVSFPATSYGNKPAARGRNCSGGHARTLAWMRSAGFATALI
jgi:hypothetical protein